jgi:threonine dehydrogenase-like Zn-dependent dehydrogenase
MFAVGLLRDKKGIYDFEIPKPEISRLDDVLVRIKEVGLDGTDFNMVHYNLQDLPIGRNVMAIGHEGVGIVEETGSAVTSLKAGDMVAITVRRGCGECSPCLHNASDMCLTGRYKERGLHKLDGFLSQYVVDQEQYIVKVPPDLTKFAVMTEPISIVEKGIQELRTFLSRMPLTCSHTEHSYLSPHWGGCKIALVVGAGPLGLIAIALLRLAGVSVFAADILPEDHSKVTLVHRMGAGYMDASNKTPAELIDLGGTQEYLDIIFEASGAANTALELIKYMARGSVYIMTGIPRQETLMQIDAAQLVRQIVRNNQVLAGSINSNRSHFEMALQDIARINTGFNGILDNMLTGRIKIQDYPDIVAPKRPNQIKTVVEVEPWETTT